MEGCGALFPNPPLTLNALCERLERGCFFPKVEGVEGIYRKSPLRAIFFPIRWAMAALGSTVGLHSDKLGKDALFGSNYTYHGLIYSNYSKQDAIIYLLLIWFALVMMIILLGLAMGYLLKKKDTRV